MAVQITDDRMTSDTSGHTARYDRHAAADGQGAWIVSWLPLRLLDRNQAITAMTIAEVVAAHELPSDSRWWLFVDGWAAELGLTGPDAVVRASTAPGGSEGGR